jgi:hypothetical protein
VERQNVVSREYKVMHRPARFKGDERKLRAQAASLWTDLARLVRAVAVSSAGDLSNIKSRRTIGFFDTRDRALNAGDYIFRERRELDGSKREVTLKFRHGDRFLAQAREMQPAGAAKAKTKFEEDIKAAKKASFISLYSFSTTVEVDEQVRWTAVRDVFQLFPDLDKRLERVKPADALKRVNNFTARELVIDGATIQIGKTPEVTAEWALIVWYKDGGSRTQPATVELSYRYGDKSEAYGGGATRRAVQIFDSLQSDLKRWVDPDPRTKTAFVFD